jgi:hypothetical protein
VHFADQHVVSDSEASDTAEIEDAGPETPMSLSVASTESSDREEVDPAQFLAGSLRVAGTTRYEGPPIERSSLISLVF